MFQLRVESGCRQGETIPLPLDPRDPLLLGRGYDATIRFPKDATMSRIHAELRRQGRNWVLRNRSKHVTLVGKLQVSDSQALLPGDVIVLGDTRLVFAKADPQDVSAAERETHRKLAAPLLEATELPSPVPPPPPAAAGGEAPTAPLLTESEKLVLSGDPSRDKRNVKLLLDTIAEVHRHNDPARLLPAIVDRVLRLTGAERGLLLLRGEEGLETTVARDRDGEDLAQVAGTSTSVPAEVIDTGQTVCLTGAREDWARASKSMQDYDLRSVLCVPIRQGASVTGVIYVDSQEVNTEFGPQEQTFLEALAAQCGIALERARLRHLEVSERSRLEEENSSLKRREAFRPLAVSPPMDEALRRIERVASSDVTLLITGETGAGKEVAARYAHELSSRKDQELVVVDCGAIPENLLESVLFGHVKGAFTGASGDQEGLAARAHGGTLMLDEVGELPLSLQPKLLRFLEERTFLPVGSGQRRQADVRLIACTHRDLAAMVQAGTFREDLFYRLNGFPVVLPPLRQRREDVEPLARLLLARLRGTKNAPPGLTGFTREALDSLRAYDWPGNVRELAHRIQRAAVTASPPYITVTDLDLEAAPGKPAGILPLPEARREAVDRFEQEYVTELLRRHQGKVQDSAKEAGVSRQMFQRLMSRHGISRKDFLPK